MNNENGHQLADREVPANDHVWEELDSLIGQVSAFQQRAAARREKLHLAVCEMDAVGEKCTRLLSALADTAGAVARAT